MTRAEINRLVADADLEGLIARGAPRDEYMAEAAVIYASVREDATEGGLEWLIRDVWRTYLSKDPLHMQRVGPLARAILATVRPGEGS